MTEHQTPNTEYRIPNTMTTELATPRNRNRKRRRAKRRRQLLQSAVVFMLVLILAVGEIVKMRASIPEPERDANTAARGAKTANVNKPAAPALSIEELTRLSVNEAGQFPILEYHDIKAGRTKMFHSPRAFRHDLERLYAENYRPISFQDYLDNHIDVPAGMTPVILTFDDARELQFRYRKDGSIDPECGVGIMQEFARTHPDFPVKATFFVLTEWGFGNHRQTAQKFHALRAMGCDLQNHTYNHHYFGRMEDGAIVREIAQGKASVEQMAPGAQVNILALPGGQHPRSKNEAILRNGEAGGIHYANRAVVDAWGGPAPSPVSRKFNPFRIPRIEPIEDGDGLTHWLDYLKTHPKSRYISDGNPNTVTLPRKEAASVLSERLRGNTLRTY